MQKILIFHKILANIIGLLILAITLIIVVDAGGRFLFDKPLLGGVEISKVLLAWILFCSLTWSLLQGAIVQVTMVIGRLPTRLYLVFEVLIAILSLLFFGLVVYAGWLQFWESFVVGEEMAAPIWVPFWLAKLAVPVGCFLIGMQIGINFVARLLKLLRG